MTEPERSLIPPDEPTHEWTDWSAPAYVSVNARTAEEAQERVAYVARRVNEFLQSFRFQSDQDGMICASSIVQLADDRLPEQS